MALTRVRLLQAIEVDRLYLITLQLSQRFGNRGDDEKLTCKASWQKELTVPRLRFAAATMLQKSEHTSFWGFKLPASMLLIPEIYQAFPRARYVHLIRDPLTTCLRRTHMTARLDNHIGRVTLPLAYRYCGFEPAKILNDSAALHMAYNVRHQVETVLAYCRSSLKRAVPGGTLL